jgi:hypothetical protein
LKDRPLESRISSMNANLLEPTLAPSPSGGPFGAGRLRNVFANPHRIIVPRIGTGSAFDRIEHWAEAINQGFATHAGEAIAFGGTVHGAKTALSYGAWEEMFRQRQELGIPFGKTTGKNWAQIGEVCGQLGQDPDHLEKLPGTFGALYQLSRLGADLLLQALGEGHIRSSLSERKAKDFVERYKPNLKTPRPPVKVAKRIARFAAFVENTVDDWSPDQREHGRTQLQAMLQEIEIASSSETETASRSKCKMTNTLL